MTCMASPQVKIIETTGNASHLRCASVELRQEILVCGEHQLEQGLHVHSREGGAPPAAVEVVADQAQHGEPRLGQADGGLRRLGEPAAQHRLEMGNAQMTMV